MRYIGATPCDAEYSAQEGKERQLNSPDQHSVCAKLDYYLRIRALKYKADGFLRWMLLGGYRRAGIITC